MKKEEYIKKLKKDGLDKEYEYRQYQYEHPRLLGLFLEVTSRCNAKCKHCGSSCLNKLDPDEISAEDLKRTLFEISLKYDPRTVFLSVTGGEPLMRKDLGDIMKYASDLGYKWGITTNGMLFTEKVYKMIEETKMATISISLDGMKETHEKFRGVPNSFDRIETTLKRLQKIPTVKEIQVTTVANENNINELENIYNYVQSIGIKNWRVATVDPIGRAGVNDDILLTPEHFKYVLDFIKEKRLENKILVEYGCSHYLGLEYEKEVRGHYFTCQAGLTIGSILSNGDIFVCPNVPRIPKLIQGNIKTDSFVDVWENKFKEFRTDKRLKSEKCKNCKNWKYCLGDSFHTFNFEDNTPNICIKDMLGEETK